MGVVVADWLIDRDLEGSVGRLLNLRGLHIGVNGLLAFLIGGLASVPFMDTSLYIGPASRDWLHYGDVGYYVGFAVALVAYLVLARVHAEAPAEVPEAIAETA